jgi:hypothetical protein
MRRILCTALAAAATLAVIQPASADWFENMIAVMKRDYKRNNCWPEPFMQPDRVHVLVAFEAITDNGWRRENMLGNHHFQPDSSRLTEAGEIRVLHILTQNPAHRRAIFVQKSLEADITAKRMDLVQQYAASTLPGAPLPEVLETTLVVEGRPAAVVDYTNVQFYNSQPAPTLPQASSGQ